MCAPGGHVITTSLPSGNISLPAVFFSIGGRTHHAGQAGGANPMRDIPRFVAMLVALPLLTAEAMFFGIYSGYAVAVHKVTYVKRFARESRVGFGAG